MVGRLPVHLAALCTSLHASARRMLLFSVHPAAAAAQPTRSAPLVSATAVIPARFESSRLPGKPLADICGRPMIEHVYCRASAATLVDRVIVATDDARIADTVRAFGGEARLTRPNHPTGSDRLAEVARELDAPVVVNVQGDEPLIEPALIDRIVTRLASDPDLGIVTACCPIMDAVEHGNPHVVKVVIDRRGDALYFSRAAIPHGADANAAACDSRAWKHIGLYAYRLAALLALADTPPTMLERTERLEQLRALEMGMRIGVVETESVPVGVDTPDDLEHVRRVVAARDGHAMNGGPSSGGPLEPRR